MASNTYTTTRKVEFPRSCSSCGHKWNASTVLSASKSAGISSWDERKAYADLEQEIQKDTFKHRSNPRIGIVCSQCGELASEATQAFFGKGIRAWLEKEWSSILGEMWWLLLASIIFGLIKGFILFKVEDISTFGIIVLCSVLLGCGFAFLFSIYRIAMSKLVRHWLDALSEAEAHDVIVAIAKMNDRSLPEDTSGSILRCYRRRNQ